MNILGIWHSEYPGAAMAASCHPHIQKGRMELSARDAATSDRLMALAYGQIRNRESLARSLGLTPGYRPSQLILKCYEKWGEDYPIHVEGPVMTAVYDLEQDRMMVTSDRMGERAVYCTMDPPAFSDHPDALLAARCATPVIDESGVCELLSVGPAMTPGRTPLRDIRRLEPGQCFIADRSGPRVKSYWSLTAAPHRDSPEETVLQVRRMLERIVNDAVPLHPACMLSGGLDSTALTALIGRSIRRVESFSVDYEGADRDYEPTSCRPEADAPYVDAAVRHIGTLHRRIVLTQQALADALGDAVDARGFPGMADVDASLLLFARKIAPHARYAVTGECGDEVFGGYPWFREDYAAKPGFFPWSGKPEIRAAMLAEPLRGKVDLTEYARAACAREAELTPTLPGESPEDARLRALQYACFRWFMPNLQIRAAAICEAGGLSPIAPYADAELAQYLFNVPWRIKRLNGVNKGLLREAVKDLLPPELLNRKKSPYPKTCSPEYTALVRDLSREMLRDRDSPAFQIVSRSAFRDLIEGEMSPTDWPWYGQLMAGPQLAAYIWQIDRWMRDRNIRVEI